MTYLETLDFLYQQLPMYSRIGSAAYKKDLTNTLSLCAHFGQPQKKFKSIHIGGTNGKGSTTNYLASMFIEAGLKVGIYTSPHLIDFRERVKIGNQMISEEFVVSFVEQAKPIIEKIQPSFFELTVVMAFQYFANQEVDIAMIEVGLGGRLDSTNVIAPELVVVTNVSFDHMQMLGETIGEIAYEKAGIIKPQVPCILGESNTAYNSVFESMANKNQTSIRYANECVQSTILTSGNIEFQYEDLRVSINSESAWPPYQRKNIKTAICAFRNYFSNEPIQRIHKWIEKGIERRTINTGFLGRWTKFQVGNKTVILESAHNEAGINEFNHALKAGSIDNALIIFGCVKDKDVTKILSLLPKNHEYVLSQSDIPRALDIDELLPLFTANCKSPIYVHKKLSQAIQFALESNDFDTIIVTGSIFLVGESLAILNGNRS